MLHRGIEGAWFERIDWVGMATVVLAAALAIWIVWWWLGRR